jgi:hypothetical protein
VFPRFGRTRSTIFTNLFHLNCPHVSFLPLGQVVGDCLAKIVKAEARDFAARKIDVGAILLPKDDSSVFGSRVQIIANEHSAIRAKLPDFARMCADDTESVMLHQDSFAADYQDDEYALLGMAIKFRWASWQGSAGDREEPKQPRRRRENPVRTRVP